MESVTMAVSNQHIPSITDINTIRVIGDVLTSNSPDEMTFFIENNNTMTLKKNQKYCQVAFPIFMLIVNFGQDQGWCREYTFMLPLKTIPTSDHCARQ